MKLCFAVALAVPNVALAGGLILPGAGAVSTSRAGTGVASTEGGEALTLNPAGMAKTKGTSITIGATIIKYDLSFQRNGTYDDDPDNSYTYEGQRYPLVTNQAKPPLGIGRFQPVPAIAVTSDLGGVIPNFTGGFGLFTVNAYPFRDMNNGYFTTNDAGQYEFPALGNAPPPSRYDIVYQDAAIVLPTLAAAYRITPDLDIGGTFSLGFANIKSAVAIWGGLANYTEDIQKDGIVTINATDSLIPAFTLGATYRPTPNIELGAHYTGQVDILAKGDAHSANGPGVTLAGTPIVIQPVQDEFARCAKGGTMTAFKACVELTVPMTATLGGRYKILDSNGKLRGDLELDADWQNWSSASDYKVTIDAQVTTATNPDNAIDLKKTIIKHGFQDTFGLRAGGSWIFPAGDNQIIARAGIGYETAAAKTGWERADLDGAARTMLTAGGSYKLSRFQIDAGVGVILEGTRNDARTCNPMVTTPGVIPGCAADGTQQPVDQRQGPDPTNPLVTADSQVENPVNAGTYKSQYLLFMLGVSTWF